MMTKATYIFFCVVWGVGVGGDARPTKKDRFDPDPTPPRLQFWN